MGVVASIAGEVSVHVSVVTPAMLAVDSAGRYRYCDRANADLCTSMRSGGDQANVLRVVVSVAGGAGHGGLGDEEGDDPILQQLAESL